MKLIFVLPELLEGSGGHRTILNHCQHLRSKGFEVRVTVFQSDQYSENLEKLNLWFGVKDVGLIDWSKVVPDSDTGYVMTAWFTALEENVPKGFKKYVYFVQDWEADFNPAGYEKIRAEKSYNESYFHITIGRYLSTRLSEMGLRSAPTPFGVDRLTYFSTNIPRQNRVAMLVQPEKPRRMFGLVKEITALCNEVLPDLEIVWFGSHAMPDCNDLHVSWAGLLNVHDLRYLYSSSMAGIALSATNPSRVPFEMLACGLPVLDYDGVNTRLDKAGPNHYLLDPKPEAFVEKIGELSSNTSFDYDEHSLCDEEEEVSTFEDLVVSLWAEDRQDTSWR